MSVLEKILEEIERTRKSIIDMSDEDPELVDVEDWFDSGVDQGKLIAYEVAKEIIRAHMDEMDKTVFKFDFNSVKSFDCQCGRHYVNTYNGGWIPVEERLPEEPEFMEDSYIVQQKNVIDPFSAYWDGKEWTDVNDNKVEEVIAWQPLPEPYRQKEKNNE